MWADDFQDFVEFPSIEEIRTSWISVDVNMPNPREKVLVVYRNDIGMIRTSLATYTEDGWVGHQYGLTSKMLISETVTHWTPVPSLEIFKDKG